MKQDSPRSWLIAHANIPASFEQAIEPITNRVIEALRAPADPQST